MVPVLRQIVPAQPETTNREVTCLEMTSHKAGLRFLNEVSVRLASLNLRSVQFFFRHLTARGQSARTKIKMN